MALRVLLTGATSFTGAHIARALSDAGMEVAATLTERLATYSGPMIQKRRMHSRVLEWVEEAPFGSARLIEFLKDAKIDVFLNHGASIKGYRDAGFDYLESVDSSVANAKLTMDTLVAAGCRRFVHSGSIFEPGEGEEGSNTRSEAISIYGVSKAMVWEPLRFFALKAGLPVSKIVIPNPIGPFENEDRLMPIFAGIWKKGGVPSLRTPSLVRDNIPATWLARVYREEAQLAVDPLPPKPTTRVRRPSGYALSFEDFMHLFARETKKRTGVNLPYEIAPQPSSEPLRRVNSEPVAELKDPTEETKFWDAWIESLGPWPR